ncbi:hypothetical protein ACVWWN_003276 [Mycobacterium sp. URHB0021]
MSRISPATSAVVAAAKAHAPSRTSTLYIFTVGG